MSSLAIYKFTLQLLLQTLKEHSKCLITTVAVVIVVIAVVIVPEAIILLGAGITIAAQVAIDMTAIKATILQIPY